MKSKYNKTVLDNGVRIITESLPGRTVSVGMLVNVGSRDEDDQNNGCSHFVEHMLFKGTASRSAGAIARQLDSLGGSSNAFTSKEMTCLYATVLDSQLADLVSIYSDLFLNSVFSPDEITRECSVILQEIDMVEDTPEDLIHELFSSLIWAGHPLGNTVLGSKSVVGSMTSTQLKNFVARFYHPENIIIVAAGNVDHHNFVDLLAKRFSFLPSAENIGLSGTLKERIAPPCLRFERRNVERRTEQSHIVLGTYGLPSNSKDRYALSLLNVLLGGNMSSALFQEVREKRGLAYSIYSFVESNSDSGSIGVYTGVNPKNVEQSIALIEEIVNRFQNGAIEKDKLENAKGYARASLYLSAENMDARMLRLAHNELNFSRQISYKEVDDAIVSVRAEDINRLAAEIFADGLGGLVLGPENNN